MEVNMTEDEQREIRKKTEACQQLFMHCLATPSFSGTYWIEDRQGEFNLWAASLKATSPGRASLDYRVRDNPDLRESICDLLAGLSEALEELLGTAHSGPTSTSLNYREDSSGSQEGDTGSIFSGFSSDGAETGSLPSIIQNDNQFSEHFLNIKTILGQLVRISTAIRRSGTKYRYQKADKSLDENDDDTKDFKAQLTTAILLGSIESSLDRSFAVDQMQNLIVDFSRLTGVQKRLINGNVVRRNRILFATRSMKRGKITVSKNSTIPAEWKSIPPTTVEGAAPSQQHAAKPKPSIPASDIAPSVVQTATEIGSKVDWKQVMAPQKSSASVVTRVTRTGAVQDYPSCPRPDSSDVLQCPYCGDILPAEYSKNSSRWRGHVAQDILPYMCICEDCETADNLYLTSDELLEHIRSNHGVCRWVCDYCSTKPGTDSSASYDSLKDWQNHMNTEHSTAFPLSQLPSLAKLSQRQVLPPLSCPLCGYATGQSQETLDEHITQHLHAFSLRCLPWGTDGDDQDSVNAKSAHGSDLNELLEHDDFGLDGNDVDPTDPSSLLRAIEDFQVPQGLPTQDVEQLYRAIWMDDWKEQRQRLQKCVLWSDFSSLKYQADQLKHQQSETVTLVDFLRASGATSAGETQRSNGRLWSYVPNPSPTFFGPKDRLQEVLGLHVMKILYLLRQAALTWHTSDGERSRALNQTQGKLSQKELEDKNADLRTYKANMFQGIKDMLEEELSAMEHASSTSQLDLISPPDKDGDDVQHVSASERLLVDISITPSVGRSEDFTAPRRVTHPVVMVIIHEVVEAEFEFFPVTIEDAIGRLPEASISDEGSAAHEYLRIYQEASGEPEKIMQLAKENQLEERLSYWLALTMLIPENHHTVKKSQSY